MYNQRELQAIPHALKHGLGYFIQYIHDLLDIYREKRTLITPTTLTEDFI